MSSKTTTSMPWCEHCQCWHHATAEHIAKMPERTQAEERSHTWDAWIGQKIVKCESFDDGRTRIVLEDGRGAIFSQPMMYFTVGPGVDPLTVAETTLKANEGQ